jgi:hypothetical protein
MKRVWAVLLAAVSHAIACQAVDGERILGKDLAAADAVFAGLDPDSEIGAAPLAGVRRIVYAEELAR